MTAAFGSQDESSMCMAVWRHEIRIVFNLQESCTAMLVRESRPHHRYTRAILWVRTKPCPALQGNMNLIRQAAKDGVKKFILVTSIGTGDSKDAPPEQVYNVLKPVLEEKAKAEDLLKVWQHLSTVPTGYTFHLQFWQMP